MCYIIRRGICKLEIRERRYFVLKEINFNSNYFKYMDMISVVQKYENVNINIYYVYFFILFFRVINYK